MSQSEVRIQGVNLKLKKQLPYALREAIYGIGHSTAKKICEKLEIPLMTKVIDLSDEQVRALTLEIDNYVVEGELRNLVKLQKKKLIDRRTYRGTRHLMGLPINSRTRTNAQTCKRLRGSRRVILDFNKTKKK